MANWDDLDRCFRISKECICMASSLTPAYVRIAGPSTANMTFKNTTISISDTGFDIDDEEETENINFISVSEELDSQRKVSSLSVTQKKWEKFVKWAKLTGFDLVYALNNHEKTTSGMWDPNNALNTLTAADKAGIGTIYWQLGYECKNQSIEEYLNDLETLQVIIETFPSGKSGHWSVVGGDVAQCLHADSKSDFKDYVTLSNDMLDAILLNGNSTSIELERMSNKDRLKLLKLLSQSTTPLWLTEHNNNMLSEFERAADWMTSLGYSARNGFSIHFRELTEKELHEPTLSFYMALLYKNLVGERVLSVELDAAQTVLFAHCTSLRHQPVPGAITFYGINMDDEPARYSIKLSKTEKGGDILQFILSNDYNGNIVVNGRAMYYEGDIRPVVRKIRPYKTLLIHLPSKSFGFWVLANTQIEACHEINEMEATNDYFHEDELSNNIKDSVAKFYKTKRSIQEKKQQKSFKEVLNSTEYSKTGQGYDGLRARINDINRHLKIVQQSMKHKLNGVEDTDLERVRREIFDDEYNPSHKFGIHNLIHSVNEVPNLLEQIAQIRNTHRERLKQQTERLLIRLGKSNPKTIERTYKKRSNLHSKHLGNTNYKTNKWENKLNKNKKNISKKLIDKRKYNRENNSTDKLSASDTKRYRRSLSLKENSKRKWKEDSLENEINEIEERVSKFGNKNEVESMPAQTDNYYYDDSSEGVALNTKISDQIATINVRDKYSKGLLKNTLEEVMSLWGDLNANLHRFWKVITVLE